MPDKVVEACAINEAVGDDLLEAVDSEALAAGLVRLSS
jgi:hypothetical protein